MPNMPDGIENPPEARRAERRGGGPGGEPRPARATAGRTGNGKTTGPDRNFDSGNFSNLAKTGKTPIRRKRRRKASRKGRKGKPVLAAAARDRRLLGRMGLGALVMSVETVEPVQATVIARRTVRRRVAHLCPLARPIGTRVYDRVLRVMDPGALYTRKELGRLSGLAEGTLRGNVGFVLPLLGLIESVDARAYARGLDRRQAKKLEGFKNLWRLTPKGEKMKRDVEAADRAVRFMN